ncbi:MAG TPA: glycosyltransferase family 2 protein [Gemmatimonadales bacterium]|nr:glycosyltransferase family 2 protein [Gemmatimonadales bacterium]
MIYVLIPSHNEAATIGLLLWKVRQVFDRFPREYQIIVVNDGSTDGTEDVLAPYARALPLTVVTNRRRQGYGRALETLFREALSRTDRPKRDMAVMLQGDFSDSPELIPEIVKRMEGGADLVVTDERGVGDTVLERAARRLLPRIVKSLLTLPGADDVIGTMRGYRLAVLARMLNNRASPGQPLLTREGWAADLELLVKTAREARTIDTVPVSSRTPHARPSRLHPVRETLRVVRAAFELRRPERVVELPTAARQPDESAPTPQRRDRAESRERRGRRGRGRGRRGRGNGGARPADSPASAKRPGPA